MLSTSLSFNGDKTKFKAYIRNKISEALETKASTSKGLCGEFFTPVEYATFFPGEAPYVRPMDPGNDIPVIGFQAPTAAQTSAHLNDVKLYKHLKDRSDKFDEALSKFKTKMLDELDPATRVIMEDPVFGSMNITILEIRQRLIAAFGEMSPVERGILFKSALAPYHGGDMRTWLNSRNLVFAELAATGEPFSVETKTRWLLDSCAGYFESATELWEGTYNTRALQTLHANSLNEVLISAYVKSQIAPSAVTASERHTLNAVTTDADIDRKVQTALAKGFANFAMANKGGTGVTGVCEICKGVVTGKTKIGVLHKYCNECFLKRKPEIAARKARRST